MLNLVEYKMNICKLFSCNDLESKREDLLRNINMLVLKYEKMLKEYKNERV